MSYTIVVTAPSLAPAGRALLEARGCDVHFVADAGDHAGLAGRLATLPVDAVISRTMEISGEMIAACPTLKVISKHGTGTSNIDVPAASRHGVLIFSTPGANSRAVSEYAVGLLIACARRVARFDRAVRAGTWRRDGDGMELAGKTLGLVGFGRIAREVGRIARALDMRVLAVDPMLDARAAEALGVERVATLADLLPQCDALSLHCPAVRGAPPLLGAAEIARMRPGAVLVNTARGELVDEAALADALESGALGAAGLDTFTSEPLAPGSRLRQLENAILSPHIAGSTPEALANMARGAVAHALDALDYLAAPYGPPPAALLECCLDPAAFKAAREARRPAVSVAASA